MEIKAVKFNDNGFMTQPFAFGGGEDASKYDASVKYPSCLQNFLIDMGNEVILVDTGLSKETKDTEPNEKTQIFVGTRIQDYMSAFAALGYKPEQVTKILVTHKHPDHTGELRSFPNAKIYIAPEDADALKLTGDNIVRATYPDGPYHNFLTTYDILKAYYKDEEEDMYWGEGQLELIDAIGKQNWLASLM